MGLLREVSLPVDHLQCPTLASSPRTVAGARFSKAPETFRAHKAIAKSRTLRLQNSFIH